MEKLNIGEHPSLFVQMADIYSDYLYLNSKNDELSKFASEIVGIYGWSKETCYVIGNLYSILQQHEKALIWLRRALMIDPNYEAALIVLGNEYIELKSPSDAISTFLAASSTMKILDSIFYSAFLELNPLNYRIYFSLGSVYYLLDDLDQSIYYLKMSVSLE